MFLTHDRLVILRDMGDVLVASCEGVVGWVRRADVHVLEPESPGRGDVVALPKSESGRSMRLQAASAPLGLKNIMGVGVEDGAGAGAGFKSIIVSPSPPQHTQLLPEQGEQHRDPYMADRDEATTPASSNNTPHPGAGFRTPDDLSPFPSPGPSDLQRISNQFDFDDAESPSLSPLHTPGSVSASGAGAVSMPGGLPGAVTPDVVGADTEALHAVSEEREEIGDGHGEGPGGEEDAIRAQSRGVRESVTSMRSDTSSALGGIGGLLLGAGGGGGAVEGLQRMMSGESQLHHVC